MSNTVIFEETQTNFTEFVKLNYSKIDSGINFPEHNSGKNDVLSHLAAKFEVSPWTVIFVAILFYSAIVAFILALIVCCKKFCCDANFHEVFYDENSTDEESDGDNDGVSETILD